MANALVNFFIYLNLFFTGYTFFKEPFEFNISYVPILLLLPIFISRYKFNAKVLYIILPLLLFGLLNIFLGNDSIPNFFKIFINISVNLVFYEYVMQHYEYDIKYVFKLYLKGAFIVSCYGIIQLISYRIGFNFGYNLGNVLGLNKWGVSLGGLGIRVNSFLSEPAYVASALGPCAFISIYTLFKRDDEFMSFRTAFINLSCYLLTFSTLAFLGVFFALLLLSLNFGAVRYLLLSIPIIIVLYIITYDNSREFKDRVDGLRKLFVDGILDKRMQESGSANDFITRKELLSRRQIIKEIHGSSFILYNNYYVAKENFYHNPLVGSGLGSHELAFKKYDLSFLIGDIYDSNGQDANSMFLRTLSEMGLLGVGFILVFVFGCYISKDLSETEPSHFWMISNALLIVLLIQLIRQGNYTFNGFFMYGWMYYYNFKSYLDYKEEVEENEKKRMESDVSFKSVPLIKVE
jgi:hypothetical protein